jgi:TPP-dependent indolepyruvate ferredoxin oxidoreductase alpha subunit
VDILGKQLLMGNEAIALGAIRANVELAAGYPGTPSSEILETLAQARPAGLYVEWSVNEKTAVEVAAGAAMCGARAMATMKQVGLNVASDPVMSLNYVGIKGGMVIVVADDPGPISSQTEQDTRHFAQFAGMALFDPSTPDEAYLMIADAFRYSEMLGRPVLFRPTTRVCHSYASVDVLGTPASGVPAAGAPVAGTPVAAGISAASAVATGISAAGAPVANGISAAGAPVADGASATGALAAALAGIRKFGKDGGRWVIFPKLAHASHIKIGAALAELGQSFAEYRGNMLVGGGRLGIAASGVGWRYACEALSSLAAAGAGDFGSARAEPIGNAGDASASAMSAAGATTGVWAAGAGLAATANPAAGANQAAISKAATGGWAARANLATGADQGEGGTGKLAGARAEPIGNAGYAGASAMSAAGAAGAAADVWAASAGLAATANPAAGIDQAAAGAATGVWASGAGFEATANPVAGANQAAGTNGEANALGSVCRALGCKLLKIGTVPLPEPMCLDFLRGLDEVLVIEELDPVIERELVYLCGRHRLGVSVKGKLTSHMPVAGEYSHALAKGAVREFLAGQAAGLGAGRAASSGYEQAAGLGAAGQAAQIQALATPTSDTAPSEKLPALAARPPVLCAGCPHRASFFAAKEAMRGRNAVFSGDIGCYTLGNAMPLDMVDTCLCMGAGIAQAQGINRVAPDTLNFAFIGDSTFFHTGIPGVVNAVYNGADIIVAVLDNSTTAMTGGQPNPGMGKTLMGGGAPILSIYNILRAIGVDDMQRVDAFDFEAAVAAVRGAAAKKGVRAIIFEGPCITLARKGRPLEIGGACTGCGACSRRLGCPAINMPAAGEKPTIDALLCTGCGLCAHVCRFGAIARPEHGAPAPQ